MTYYEWLMTQSKMENPTGDLARDAKGDRRFRRSSKTLESLVNYLNSQDACYDAIRVARTSWSKWQKQNKPALVEIVTQTTTH